MENTIIYYYIEKENNNLRTALSIPLLLTWPVFTAECRLIGYPLTPLPRFTVHKLTFYFEAQNVILTSFDWQIMQLQLVLELRNWMHFVIGIWNCIQKTALFACKFYAVLRKYAGISKFSGVARFSIFEAKFRLELKFVKTFYLIWAVIILSISGWRHCNIVQKFILKWYPP